MEIVKIYGTGTCKHLPKNQEEVIDKRMADFLVGLGRASFLKIEEEVKPEVKEKVEVKEQPKMEMSEAPKKKRK